MPTPAKAWERMARGNERFVAGQPRHPRQDVERRAEVEVAQRPDAALFGCSDSRLAAEIIFDKGLGDLFVVRNAGQVVSDSVVGSLEYAVGVLGVTLIVVLAHDRCGAVQAAIDQTKPDAAALPVHIHSLVDQIVPSVHEAGTDDPAVVGVTHLRATVAQLLTASELISDAVAAGDLAIVGANYRLLEGRVETDVVVGTV